jgi:hypothetical protein
MVCWSNQLQTILVDERPHFNSSRFWGKFDGNTQEIEESGSHPLFIQTIPISALLKIVDLLHSFISP